VESRSLLWRAPVSWLLAAVIAEAALLGAADLPSTAIALTYAACSVVAAFLLTQNASPLLDEIVAAAATGAGAALLIVMRTGGHVNLMTALALGLGVFALLFALRGITCAFARFNDAATGHRSVLCLLALTAAAPLWLGPVAAWPGVPSWMPSAVIDASALTYLASMADFDLYRSDWFYRHTPFGGLRYSYPPASITTIAYLALGALTRLAARKPALRAGTSGFHIPQHRETQA
jgi:hypothetical protein